MRKKRKFKKLPFSKVFKPPKSKYFLITFKTILFLGSLAGLTTFFIWLFTGNFFKIKSIDCIKENFSCSSEENSLFENFYGQNIFLLQARTCSQQIINKDPKILKAKISKKLANSLKIILISRKTAAIVETGKEKLLVDNTGFVFANAEETRETLPIIVLSQAIAIGETLTGESEKKALLLIRRLQDSFIQFDKIRVFNKDFLEVYSTNKMIATFSGRKALVPQVDSLQYILNHSKINGKVIKVDLRFDKPILIK